MCIKAENQRLESTNVGLYKMGPLFACDVFHVFESKITEYNSIQEAER